MFKPIQLSGFVEWLSKPPQFYETHFSPCITTIPRNNFLYLVPLESPRWDESNGTIYITLGRLVHKENKKTLLAKGFLGILRWEDPENYIGTRRAWHANQLFGDIQEHKGYYYIEGLVP